MSELLPANSTRLERNLATVGAAIERIPVPLRDLFNPDRCPLAYLPFLAWAMSVDRWSADWPEATKRAVIKSAFFIHQRKGTIGALRRVVEPLGFLLRVTEWWQTVPEGEPGTFRLDIGVREQGITDEMYDELVRLIDDAKPLTRHLTGLAINLEVKGTANVAVAAFLGDETTVYAYSPGPVEVELAAGFYARLHLVDTLTVNPNTSPN